MDLQIPDKLYFKIGEVSELTGIKSHVLRYWESEFSAIRPNKSRSQQRLYRKQDIELILHLKDLLYNQGFTIAGARKQLRSKAKAQPVHKAQPAQEKPAVAETSSGSDQLTLEFAPGVDRALLKEIKQDLQRLKKSLEATS